MTLRWKYSFRGTDAPRLRSLGGILRPLRQGIAVVRIVFVQDVARVDANVPAKVLGPEQGHGIPNPVTGHRTPRRGLV